MKRKNLIKTSFIYGGIIIGLTGCTAKTVDCNIEESHVHLYVNEDNNLSRYVESEKEYIEDLIRTEEYLPMTKELSEISENSLYRIEDNEKYLEQVSLQCYPKREAYVYDYVYGTYYGYRYGYSFNGKFEYSYGLTSGYHWDYEWQEIPLDEYTTDKVQDITYQYQLYKINEDGTLSKRVFESLEEVPEEYKYFTPDTLVKENVSNPYYLDSKKIKTR